MALATAIVEANSGQGSEKRDCGKRRSYGGAQPRIVACPAQRRRGRAWHASIPRGSRPELAPACGPVQSLSAPPRCVNGVWWRSVSVVLVGCGVDLTLWLLARNFVFALWCCCWRF